MIDDRDVKPENVVLGVDGEPLETGNIFGKVAPEDRIARAHDRLTVLRPLRDGYAELHRQATDRTFKAIGASKDLAKGEATGLDLAIRRIDACIRIEERVLAPKGRAK